MEFKLSPRDRIEFVGTAGDSDAVYHVELGGFIVIWEWDANSNVVKLNGTDITDWPNPSPSLFGEWMKRMEDKNGPSKSVTELIRAARINDAAVGSVFPATSYGTVSVCTAECQSPDQLASTGKDGQAILMEEGRYYVVESLGHRPHAIEFNVFEDRFEISPALNGEVTIWKSIGNEQAIELTRA